MSRRSYNSDYGEFFVERERNYRYRNNPGRPESTTGSRNGSAGRNSTLNFDEDEIYYFGVVQLPLHTVSHILRSRPPPPDYFQLPSMERAVYLYYYTLYNKYITSVDVFHQVFNREFYKYTAAGHSISGAFAMICQHTKKEHERYLLKLNQQAYNKSQKRLFSDDRESPESRNSERQSVCGNESDLNSVDSISKESQMNGPLLHRVPHSFMRFAAGGKVVYLNPAKSVTTVCIDDAKNFYLDSVSQRNIDAVEAFKGPMLVGRTPPQAALLFIQRQIDRIRRSDVYHGNQQSGDTNDCLLIWNLLEILVRQQGKVTGPDLARLLIADYSYSSFTAQNFQRGGAAGGRASANGGNDGVDPSNEHNVNLHAMDKFTQFLLGGLAEEALESAMRDGLLFDALMLANRLYRNDPRKLNEIEMKLLQYRAQQHPVMTLLSVAGGTNVPLLTNTTTEDASGWRAHVAIVLANLHSDAATNTVYQTGLALAQKEFNSAADFCFLAVNLLTGRDCCFNSTSKNPDSGREHIKLISASLPDYDSTDSTPFGWSILDYQATEIFEYTQSMAAQGQKPTALSQSIEFQKCRLQYAKLISTYGGFATHVSLYCSQIACSIWDRLNAVDGNFVADLYQLADSHRHIGNTENIDNSWIEMLRSYQSQNCNYTIDSKSSNAEKPTKLDQHQPTPHVQPMNVDVASTIANDTLGLMNPPLGMSTPRINGSLVDVSRIHGHNVGEGYDRSKRVSDATSIAAEGLYNSPLPPNHIGVQTLPDNFEAPAVVQPVAMNFVQPPAAVSPSPPLANVQVPPQGYYYGGGYSDPSTPVSRDMLSQQPLPQFPPIENQMDGLSIGDQIVPPAVHQPTYDAYDQFSAYAGHHHQQPAADAYSSSNNDFDNGSADMQSPTGASTKEMASPAVKNSGGGLFSGLKKSLVKYIPSSKGMHLPDDKNPGIVYDPDRQCYVGNVEQEAPPPPPPTGLPVNGYALDAVQSAPSEPPSFDGVMGGGSVMPMLPIPIPDGATLPSSASKRNGRLPQKRYANAGFNN